MKYLIGGILITMLCCTCHPHLKTKSPSFNGLYVGHIDARPIYFTINHSRNNHVAGYYQMDGVKQNLSGGSDGYEVVLNDTCKMVFEKDTVKAQVSMGKKSFSIEKVKDIQVEDGITYRGLFFGYYIDFRNYPTWLHFDPDGGVIMRFYPTSKDPDKKNIMIQYYGTWEFQHACVKIYWHPIPGCPTPASSYYPSYTLLHLFEYQIEGLKSEDSISYRTIN